MSTRSRPGTTIAPSSSTRASSESRTEISMSVALRCRRPSAARSMMPARICTLVRVDTPRPTTWSFSASSSFPQTTRIVVSATVSMEFI